MGELAPNQPREVEMLANLVLLTVRVVVIEVIGQASE